MVIHANPGIRCRNLTKAKNLDAWAKVAHMPGRASIIIPAHNEERRIGRLLSSLSDVTIKDKYDVFVVCNGCTDRTLEVASQYPNVTVVEIETIGKHHALNEGDRLATSTFPRLYCDADIFISPTSITALIEALSTDEVRVAGPSVHYGSEDSTWAVRMFYRALETPVIAPWLSEHLVGRGIYGASQAARSRFETFPQVTADDLYFDSMFALSEKVTAKGAVATLWVPKSLRQLVRGEVRVAEGNRQQRKTRVDAFKTSTDEPATPRKFLEVANRRISTLTTWFRSIRIGDVIPLLVYLAVIFAARSILFARKSFKREIEWR